MGENGADKHRYRSSFGATILFSGVQVYQILISVIKSKFVALFIGPAGMGIASLLSSTTDLLSAATNFGLRTSGVKSVASAYSEGDYSVIAKTITVLRRLILITGLIGTLLCIALAPIWSQMSFGNHDYTISFIIVSLVILFGQLNSGELALLQGMRQQKRLARINVIGQTVGLLTTVPLYYFYGIRAIVWVLVLSAFITYVITRIATWRVDVEKVNLSWRETFSLGKEMIKLGFFLSLQFFMGVIITYVVRNFVSVHGGVDEVGLYSAGTSIVSTYLGLVFSAIATDYFPRLAAAKNKNEMSLSVHTQAELTILLLTPLAVAFIVFCKPVILLLYSNDFLPIEYMMYWSIGAVLLQAMGWALSYTFLAKAKPVYFFLNELVSNAWGLPIKLLFYNYWGLTGFGMATMFCYGLYLIQVLIVAKKLFGINYDQKIWKQFIILNIPVLFAAIVKILLSGLAGYIIGVLVLLISTIYVLFLLDKKLDIRSLLRLKFGKQGS